MTDLWFAVRTKPMGEYATRDRLVRAGVEVFLPRTPAARPRPGQQDVPLFPGYLFVRHDMTCGWNELRAIDGSMRLVTFGEAPPPSIPDGVIAELAQRVGRIAAEGGVWPRFQPGDAVSVVMGNTETLGEVLDANQSAEARVHVLLEFLGRLVDVKLPTDKIRLMGYGRLPRRTRGRGRWIGGFRPAATPLPVR